MKYGFLIALSLIVTAAPAAVRTWTEAATGKKIEATFVSATGQTVTVTVAGGRSFTLERARLSPEDQAFVQQQLTTAAAPPAATANRKAKDRFEDVKKLTAEDIPVSGLAHPALAAVDAAVVQFMVEKGVPAVTFALSKKGEVVHDRAFGWADAGLKTPLQPGVKMRLASLTKPVVKAAIQTLVAAGKLKPEDRVFELLELAQYKEAQGCDPRWSKVTLQQLLDHQGGWDREAAGDLTTRSTAIMALFRLKTAEIEPMHVVRYGLTLPLDFDPGAKESYCNYGYILLARVVEKISGQPFIGYVQSSVGQAAKASSFSLSRTDARDRQPDEIWYCYHPEYPQEEVPLTFRTEARDGAGVLACTAADYCRFLETYWISGQVRAPGQRASYAFNGSHPGVTAVCAQRADGLNYTALANRREGAPADWNGDLRKLIDTALETVAVQVK
ncbi:serine hydrolase domain-containing protein [Prosthecobacter dejongeii]|uniref:CubicO group peptidase (Beta-lactamase class C family) n=1 Tax=Prosthecobacter dejongeii TaxID=48465 RepID=A0A7W7YM22_9BACT|nr:serine hydrolase domain-containing protein [Prosthecobacter dejongeii]MBB5038716.1 CubicO group peptidase (beta-lactamase class C family) [Prosthecobacter dejongeii]